jgi:tetratricopeptide (TPR) repeat protein
MLAILLLFSILLAGALALFLREENRRSLILSPAPEAPVAPAGAEPAAPAEPPAPVPADVRPPTPAVLEDSLRMEEALAAYREASGYLRAQRPDLAEQRLRAALAINPDMAPALRLLGIVCLQDGRLADSIAHFERSLQLDPLHPDALSNLAFAYFQAKNINVALELIDTCRRLHPDYVPALLQEGLIKLAVDPEAAIDALRAATEAEPGNPGPRNNLAVALARSGDFDGAREQLVANIDADPNDFTALFNLAALYAKETNATESISWLARAMHQVPPEQFRTYLFDPDFDPIRRTPDFAAFLRTLDPDLPPPPSVQP